MSNPERHPAKERCGAELAAQRIRAKEAADQAASLPADEPAAPEGGGKMAAAPSGAGVGDSGKKGAAAAPGAPSRGAGAVGPSAAGARKEGTDASSSASKLHRGHKGKQKRIAAKYAHQDEEDAELLHQWNAAAGPTKSRNERKAERQARKAAKKAATSADDAPNMHLDNDTIVDVIAKAKQSLQVAEDAAVESEADSGDDEVADGGKDGDDSEHDAGPGDVIEEEPEDADEAAQLQKQANELAELQALTGQPREDDVLLYAIPVCAPYDVLQKYKYKVKLMPGAQKKGKAARQAVDLLTRLPEVTPREKMLLQAVSDPENIGAIIGNVKISMPGMTKLKKEQKKAKKTAKD